VNYRLIVGTKATRVIYAVGSDDGWPPEVFALFETQAEAQRHADKSAYLFRVFPLRVYASYAECPPSLRMTDVGAGADHLRLLQDHADATRVKGTANRRGNWTVYAVGSNEEWSPEVDVLYEKEEDARRHVDATYYMLDVHPLPVYASYEDCPSEKRYLRGGPQLSQLVKAK
jgi:hypothetical protein